MPTYYRCTEKKLGYSTTTANDDNITTVLFTDHVVREMEDTEAKNAPTGWKKIELLIGRSFKRPTWIKTDKIDVMEKFSLVHEISEPDFVIECVAKTWRFNEIEGVAPHFADADYLLALASIQSSTENLEGAGPDSLRIGPFGITEEEWKSFLASEFALDYLPASINNPYSQINCAIFLMHNDTRELAKLWKTNEGIGANDDPYLPRFGELLRCRMIGISATFHMQKALKDGDPNQPIDKFLEGLTGNTLDAAEIKALLTDRKKFMRSGGTNNGTPQSIQVFGNHCANILNEKLKKSFTLIKTHVPESVAIISTDAPWMAFAQTEMGKGVNETGPNKAQIAAYFQSTGFTAGNHNHKWCAAFVSWCIDQCNPEVSKSYKGFKATAAAAASWRNWGNTEIHLRQKPPVGSVVVLSPSKKTDKISHVGFYKSFNDAKRLVTILGGNQNNEINETDFKAADIVGIRWLQTATVFPPGTIGSATDPKYNSLLTLIASKESGGKYNAHYGNENNNNPEFTSKSVSWVRAWQDEFVGDGSKSSAVGKYQIIRKTMDGLIKSMKLTGTEIFDEDLQDRMAIQLLNGRGLRKYLAKQISTTRFGNFLAMEWASFPVLSDIKGRHHFVTRGESYYRGDNLNRAHVSPAAVELALADLKD